MGWRTECSETPPWRAFQPVFSQGATARRCRLAGVGPPGGHQRVREKGTFTFSANLFLPEGVMGILYGIPLSTFTRKVRIALGEKQIPYELRPIEAMGRKSPELLAMNPLGKIPVYVDGDVVVPDSSVIIAYLEKVHPDRPLYPSPAGDYARALFIEEYADTRLRETSAAFFYQRTLRRLYLQKPPEEAALATAAAIRDECFGWLEHMLGGGPFLVGEALSVADVAVAAQIMTLLQGEETIDPARWPKLAAYVAGLQKRPVMAALAEEEAPLLVPAGKP